MLTTAQKTAIRRHLGFHSVTQSLYPLVDGFSSINTVIDGLAATPETETQAVAILDRLAAFETQLASAPTRMKASRVGSIGLNSEESNALWREIKRWRRELSTLIGIPLHDGGGSRITVT